MFCFLSGDPVFQVVKIRTKMLGLYQMPSIVRLHVQINVIVDCVEAVFYNGIPRFADWSIPRPFTMISTFRELFRLVGPKLVAHFYCSKVYLNLPLPQLVRWGIRLIHIRKGAGEVSRTHPFVPHYFLSLRVTTVLPAGPRGHQLDHTKILYPTSTTET